MGAMTGGTLVRALEMHRVLGHDADSTGTSVLAPIDDIVGRPLFSPLVNITTNRAAPQFGAAKWDDEGVETEAFPLVERGCVVDYFATRESASALSSWYNTSGRRTRPHGSAVAWSATMSPTGAASNVTVDAGAQGQSLVELARRMGDGLLLRGMRGTRDAHGIDTEMDSDQQLAGGTFVPMMMFEVKRGQITRRLIGGAVQFRTIPFFRSIIALGDTSTCEDHALRTVIPQTWERMTVPVVSPAVQVEHVDLMQWRLP
jgi:predicted Zn-dependent protease